jgi:ABC-2 type transport system permease protein
MLAIIKKELRLFFGSLGGYLIIIGFLFLNSLWLWLLKSDSNILESGFADLTHFFNSTAWLFILVAPALTMKTFSEEIQTGTIEIIKTKPIANWELVSAKFFSVLIIILLMLTPTLTYVFSIRELALPVGNIDTGILLGSYIGLLFLGSVFIAAGLWISATTKNTLVSLLGAVMLSFCLFDGIEEIGLLLPNYNFENLSLRNHFSSIARGVIDTRDILFFTLLTILFLILTAYTTSSRKNKKTLVYTLLILLCCQWININFYARYDLTSDKKYTLSKASIAILDQLDETAVLKVYLEGNFPSEFKRLQTETKQTIKELKAITTNLKALFIDPSSQLDILVKKGLTPSRLTVEENGIISESVIVPWAELSYKNKTASISLLKNSNPEETQEQQLENSVQNLEFTFINALKKVSSEKEKSIAILAGNGELEDIYLYSLLENLGENYHLGKFTLDSIKTNSSKTLSHLQTYDLAIIAKPTVAFSEAEKYALDQYILNGGKTLWMIDNVQAEMDSLYSSGKTLAYPRDLNLDDFFFRYGVRIKQNLVKDLYASKIALATGNTGNKTNFDNFLWFYAPLVRSKSTHPIIHNISPVSLSFTSSIDTLKNNIKKTILLQSSVLSKEIQIPTIISLNSVMEKPNPKTYRNGNKIMGILLEGAFTSAYKDRIKPLQLEKPLEIGVPNKMIVIADGDIAKNQTHKGKPIDLGLNKWTREYYGNKELLLNSIEYLLNDTGLISIRSKKISLKSLDKKKVLENKSFWQLLNLILPILITVILGSLYSFYKRKKYSNYLK